MADANTELTLEGLHDAIATQLAAAFPAFRTVEFYRADESEAIATPALLLELTELEPAPDQNAGTGQWCSYARFEARIILTSRHANTKLEVRKTAAAIATFLNLRHWIGVAADECQVIACEPDEFTPKLDRFEVWRVEWVNLVMLGISAWQNEGQIPEQPYYAFSPKLGHTEDYTSFTE